MLLYILIGLLGSILPAMEKNLFKIYNYNNILLLRFLLGLICITFIVLYNIINNSINKSIGYSLKQLTKLSFKSWIYLLFYSLLAFTHLYTILYIFNKDMKLKYSISQIITIMMIITIITTFIIDIIIFKHKFNLYNYIGISMLLFGIILMRYF
jgi:drug/metabolite transporter (DMT)-like permease